MQRKHETASDEPMTWENGGYWGVCPRCRRNDGYINAGRSHLGASAGVFKRTFFVGAAAVVVPPCDAPKNCRPTGLPPLVPTCKMLEIQDIFRRYSTFSPIFGNVLATERLIWRPDRMLPGSCPIAAR
jgi:hypothetical protein